MADSLQGTSDGNPVAVDIVSGSVTITNVGLTDAELRASPVPVSGTIATTGLTDAELRASPVPVSGSLTDTQLRATAVPVSGTVTATGTVAATQSGTWTVQPGNTANTTAWKVDGSAVTQPVSGTVTATGPLTDTQLRATAVPVSGTFFQATQPISGTVTATGPLTDTQLRATAVPVSGTVTATGTVAATQSGTWTVQPGNTANTTAWKVDGSAVTQPVSGPLTDTQLRATAVPVSGTFFQVTQPVSGTVTATGPLTDTQLRATAVPVSGTVTATGTVAATQSGTWTVQPGNTANTTAWKVDGSAVTQPVSGPLTDTQLRATAVPVSGTVTATGPLTDTQLRATAVPVSSAQSGTWTVQPGNTANTTAWKVDGSAVTQPVSGSVTANIGTSGSLALDATLTGGTQKSKLVDSGGTNLATVSAGGALKVDGSAVTQPISGNITATPFAALSSEIDGYQTLTSTGDTTLIAAGGAGTRGYITSIAGSNTSATAVRIDIKDASTVKHSFYLAASGGGFSHTFPFPWRLSDNGALVVAISATVTDVRVSATGFRI